MTDPEIKKEAKELSAEEMEKVCGGSWLGRIWNKIKDFGGGSGQTDVMNNQ